MINIRCCSGTRIVSDKSLTNMFGEIGCQELKRSCPSNSCNCCRENYCFRLNSLKNQIINDEKDYSRSLDWLKKIADSLQKY